MTEAPPAQPKVRRTVVACAGIAAGMAAAAYASVPLYNLFCKATGFQGTPVVRALNDARVSDREMSVRFDANVSPSLTWRFAPETPQVKVKLGQTTTVLYRVTNVGNRPATGIAAYNVQPDLAGSYFSKLECFCFTEQTLGPGETAESAVVFYVDPEITKDPDIKDIDSITLSYTYFPSKGGQPVAEATPAKQPIVQ